MPEYNRPWPTPLGLSIFIVFSATKERAPNLTVSRPDASAGFADHFISTNICGTDNDFDRPSGTGLSASLPRHFVPAYYQPVPPGQKPFAHRGATQLS